MNSPSLIANTLVALLIAETAAYKKEHTSPHTHVDIRATVLTDVNYNVSGVNLSHSTTLKEIAFLNQAKMLFDRKD